MLYATGLRSQKRRPAREPLWLIKKTVLRDMIAEFEEKQFEQALNFELIRNHRLLYVPGQVLENTLGFDSALFTANWNFWRNFPEQERLHRFRFFRHIYRYFDFFPDSMLLRREFWNELSNEFNNEDFFPKIKFNTFIQHKRPEYLIRENATEWTSWNNPFDLLNCKFNN